MQHLRLTIIFILANTQENYIWNQIPTTTRNLSKIRSFQNEIKAILQNDLNTNRYDIDIAKIFMQL